MPRTLFDLSFDGVEVFDGSPNGVGVTSSGSVTGNGTGTTIEMAASTRIRVGRHEKVDALAAFTLEATVHPDQLGRTQTLVDSQTPPVRLTLDRSGIVTGQVHTADGWQKIKSRARLGRGKDTRVRFIRSARGSMSLEINGRGSGTVRAAGDLVPVGRGGMSIGADVRGETGFAGSIGGVRLLEGAFTTGTMRRLLAEERRLSNMVSTLYGVNGTVITDEGEVDPRFNQIKAIMHAAGVADLSKLSTLQVTRHTVLTPGTILKAPEASTAPVLADWSGLAKEFSTLSVSDASMAKRLLDGHLLTRHVGRRAAIDLGTTPSPSPAPTPVPGTPPVRRTVPGTRSGTAQPRISDLTGNLRRSPVIAGSVITRRLTDVVIDLRPPLTHIEGLERLEREEPSAWPVMSVQPLLFTSTILPVDSAVIIARRLDLTNQTLEIDPAVGTLYIIAEDIEASSGAAITWKRTPLATPTIGPDPSLDGMDRYGVDLAPNSKHGLPGGDARDGAPGIPGYNGQDAPNVEIWALRFNGMPDIDLEGQQGGKGGRGQRGGEGGNGARGRSGEYYWFFGRHCWSGPGNGGDGGDGGDGGRGGRAANGGDAGNITFAVLAETLPALTTTNAFTVNLDGGDAGLGGAGGSRGEGGRGGRAGYTEVCSQAKAGARGQPGRVGPTGTGGGEGADSEMRIMTVTQESWDEQLTRPWLYDVTPNATLPDSNVVLKGSRFADTDDVFLGSTQLASNMRADGGLDVSIPANVTGGDHSIYTRRHDGQESNRLPLVVRPQLTGSLPDIVPGTPIAITGRAFLSGATVEYGSDLYPATVTAPTALTFEVPDTAGPVSNEQSVTMAVINPDGYRSNELMGTIPRVLKTGFQIGVHDFSFANDSDGRPSWGTFEDTFGAVEVWHELLDPIFGHPILTTAFYFFYEHFLKGEDNGGLATGFCTALASKALDRYWLGHNDSFTAVTRDAAFRREMTAIHGRLLSRESLLDFHDQGRNGQANVVSTFNEIESIFAGGGIRETAPMLFFVPSGAAWDSGYFDMLADSHCIVPIRIVYPTGYDGSSLAGVRMYCWDNNHPGDHECYVDFRRVGNQTFFTYTANGAQKFRSEDGITLATATLGEYLLRDVDLPFGGPLGLTTFVLDFLLSPATMQVIDDTGRVTGRVGGQILSEIPDSHPAYLVPGAYLLPKDVGLTRRITGTATGNYGYGSLSPDGLSMSLNNVPTSLGETDRVLSNGDGSRVRFIPAISKTVDLTLGRRVGDVVRGVSIDQFTATPSEELDVTATPDLSVVRVSNRGTAANVDVKLLGFDLPTETRESMERGGIPVPAGHDLVVAVTDWTDLVDANVTTTTVEM